MERLQNYISTAVILIVSILIAWLHVTSAAAGYVEQHRMRLYPFEKTPTQTILEMLKTRDIIKYLRDNKWVRQGITDEELENYILLVEQNCEGRTYVTPHLVLGMIAVESHFDPDAYSSGTYGLMQLSPMYHRGRMMQFNDGQYLTNKDFYIPYLNIATGVDYIEEIFAETMTYDSVPDKQAFSLMWYNQGALSASGTYSKGIISDYAKTITAIAEDLGHIYSKGDVYCAAG